MKLVIAIVNKDDSGAVAAALLDSGFSATKMATTGGFLKSGNTTFLVGVEEEQVDDVIEVIKKHSSRRMQLMSDINPYSGGDYVPSNIQVTVGGATVFVVDVDSFHKL